MNLSIVIPLFNEEESLPELSAWIERVMNANNYTYEVVFVDDGSTDKSWSVLEEITKVNQNIKAVRFRRNHGKSAGLNVGFKAAQGDVIITMDADLQDSPDEIPELYDLITKEGFDLISGWKKKRYDPISKTLPTKLFNWAARKASKVYLHDFNCGLKAYKKEVVKNIEVQGEMHRYIPFLAKNAGYHKIGEKVVMHQARKYGHTKFGWERFINGFLDLVTLAFIGRFAKRPMHFFGLLGTVMFALGFLGALYLGIDKIVALQSGNHVRLITDNPVFYIALIIMVLGTQLFLTGFVAELVIRHSNRQVEYTVGQRLNF